jgi:hypothetical protein
MRLNGIRWWFKWHLTGKPCDLMGVDRETCEHVDVVGLQQQDWDEHRDSDADMNNGTQP